MGANGLALLDAKTAVAIKMPGSTLVQQYAEENFKKFVSRV
jgi:hypothetical protein